MLAYSLQLIIFLYIFLATTIQDIWLELAKEDSALAAQGILSPHETSLTSFLVIGLELEEQQ